MSNKRADSGAAAFCDRCTYTPGTGHSPNCPRFRFQTWWAALEIGRQPTYDLAWDAYLAGFIHGLEYIND